VDDATGAMNAEQRAELEAERAFLLGSLRDLDAEHDAGDVDEHDYLTLRDGYTARAATVLRRLAAGQPAARAHAPIRWGRIALGIGIVVVVAVGAGWLVARSAGQRLPGDEISGGVADPNSVTVLLAQARGLLGTDPVSALDRYEQVLERREEDPEALTYSAWLLYQFGPSLPDASDRDSALVRARQRLTDAISADDTYADPHCFLAVIAANSDGDPDTARTEGDACLALNPPADVRALMEPFLAGLDPTVPAPPASAG
jgi:hypothetical protein